MKFKIIFLGILCISLASYGQHDKFDQILQKNVSNKGIVSYKAMLAQKSDLTSYINYLKTTSPDESWSKDREKAFWMNAYNAYTILLIVENYPVKSILKIQKNGKDAWHQNFAVVGGVSYTLNQIEHEILRKKFSDPRIHVGVNCASYSCPALPNYAFTEQNVDAKLQVLMKDFINDPSRNLITVKKVTLSKIFEWYKEDFTKNGSLIAYINTYTDLVLSKKTKVRYMEYNWNLNE